MSAASLFSTTVDEADRKFQDACAQHSVIPQLSAHPLTGPAGETLNLGVCRLGPADAGNRLLIISGTHGVEGFAGAAIQTGWVQEYGAENLPDDTCMLMVHIVNPWGMAWNRRETEDNVDLFRNLIYCKHPNTPDPLYDPIDDLLDLANWSEHRSRDWQERAESLIAKHGRNRLISAIRRGQHHRPKSMTYHGTRPTWSYLQLHRIVSDNLQDARRIAVVDIHTGFGGYGEGLVMSYDPPDSLKHQRVSSWFSGDIYTPGTDADIPDHRARLPFEWIESLIPDSEVTAEILEFGTADPGSIGEIFNANHHFHLYGDPLSDEGQKWGRRYRAYCYPEEPDWMNSVWSRGHDVLQQTLAGLSTWSKQ